MDDLEAERLRIAALQDGAIRVQALAFAVRSRLFDRLATTPMTAAALACAVPLADRVAPALVAFLASERLIERDGAGRFHNTPAAQRFLVSTSPDFTGGRALLFAGFHDQIGRLGEALASGRPIAAGGQADMFGGFDAEAQRWFAEGMIANATHGARALLATLDLSAARRLLDIGGGAGGYAIPIAEACPDLEVTIVDLEAIRALAEERIAAHGLSGRVCFEPASFFDDALPDGHDIALLANILHDWETPECETILARCHAALVPGGTVAVTEPMLAEDLTGPSHPAASGLTMALLGGENRTPSRIGAMLAAAGFVGVHHHPLGEQNTIVTARRSEAPQ